MLEEVHIAFTGPSQRCVNDSMMLRALLTEIHLEFGSSAVIRTGACIGTDALVARIATRQQLHVFTIVPAYRGKVDVEWQQWCASYHEMLEETSFRDRNTYMVQGADYVFACFRNRSPEALQTGEGMTYRIAQRMGIPTICVYFNESE